MIRSYIPRLENLHEHENEASNWTALKFSTVVENGYEAPDGTLTADAVVENYWDNTHGISEQFGDHVPITLPFSVSVFVKPFGPDIRHVTLRLAGDGLDQSYVTVDMANREVFHEAGNHLVSSGINKFEDGWNRIWFISDKDLQWSSMAATVFLRKTLDTQETEKYVGDGASGILVWGARKEIGTLLNPY